MTERSGKDGPSGPHGTRFLGAPGGVGPAPDVGRGLGGARSTPGGGPPPPDRVAVGSAETVEDGERSARLPGAPSPDSWASAPAVPWPAPGEIAPPGGAAGPVGLTPLPLGARRSSSYDAPLRQSLYLAMRQQRTTLHDVGDLARRLTTLAPGLAEASLVTKQVAVSIAIALAVVLLGTMVISAGTVRLVLGVLAGMVATTLAVFAALRVVSSLGSRRGARQLPGSSLIWVGGVVFVAVGAAAALTWGVSEATRPLVRVRLRPQPSAIASASASPAPAGSADVAVRRGVHVPVAGRGLLYAPPGFSAPNGQFDLVLHYHGSTELVEQSFAAAELNALVVVTNLGEGSDRYAKPHQSPLVFDQLLGSVEAAAESGLGLSHPRIRRIALSAWSAGYAALHQLLGSRSRLDRVDALLLLDGIHGSYLPGSRSEVHPLTYKSFRLFAERAINGEKLMVVTHSAIETEGYASTTRTTDALLASLGLTRREVSDPARSPAPVNLPVALNAFPTGERRWLTVTSEVREGDLYVLGCRGKGKGDHVAHLAQMSTSALPLLVARWR